MAGENWQFAKCRRRLVQSRQEDGAIMAVPKVRTNQIADDGAATESRYARLASYQWVEWVFPVLGIAMLAAILAAYLGIQNERDAIAGVALVVLGVLACGLMMAFVRLVRLLARDAADWLRSTKRAD